DRHRQGGDRCGNARAPHRCRRLSGDDARRLALWRRARGRAHRRGAGPDVVKAKYLLIAAKLAVSVALLVWILSKLDLAASASRLLQADPVMIGLGLLLLVLNVAVVALRWWLLLRRLGFEALTLPEALSGTYASVFAGQALPGNLGAEAVRGWL